MKKLLKISKILKFNELSRNELIIWIVFFSLFILSEVLAMVMLSYLLLIIGLTIGWISLTIALYLSKKDYVNNKNEINYWLWRLGHQSR